MSISKYIIQTFYRVARNPQYPISMDSDDPEMDRVTCQELSKMDRTLVDDRNIEDNCKQVMYKKDKTCHIYFSITFDVRKTFLASRDCKSEI
jgi:hypothetical protein